MPIAASQYGMLAKRSRAANATTRQKQARAAFPTLPLQAVLTAGDSGATSTRLDPCGDQPRHKDRDGSYRSGFGAPDYAPLRLRARPSGGDRRQYCGSKIRSLALPSFRLALARLRSRPASKPWFAVGRRPKDAELPDLTPSRLNPARLRASLGAAPRPSAPRCQHAARQQTPLACILQPPVAQPWSLLPAPLVARGEGYQSMSIFRLALTTSSSRKCSGSSFRTGPQVSQSSALRALCLGIAHAK